MISAVVAIPVIPLDPKQAWYRLIQGMPMTADWIDDTIKGLEKAQESQRKTEEAKRIREAADSATEAAIRAQAPAIMEHFYSVIDSDIKKINAKFTDQNQKWLTSERSGEEGIRVQRTFRPMFSLDITFDSNFRTINFRRVSPRDENTMSQDEGDFFVSDLEPFKLTYKGKEITFEAASSELLKPALISLYGL